MARVIHAEEMLTAYAALYPEQEMVLNVTDNELSGNDGCYRIGGGVCIRMDDTSVEAESLTIAQLTHRVLAEENPLMSLMMND